MSFTLHWNRALLDSPNHGYLSLTCLHFSICDHEHHRLKTVPFNCTNTMGRTRIRMAFTWTLNQRSMSRWSILKDSIRIEKIPSFYEPNYPFAFIQLSVSHSASTTTCSPSNLFQITCYTSHAFTQFNSFIPTVREETQCLKSKRKKGCE